RVAVTCDPAAGHLEAYQLSGDSGLALRLERVLADERRLVPVDEPAEARFERGRGLVDVVSVERELGFETKGVACTEADRLDSVRPTELEQRLPEVRRVRRSTEDFGAVFTRIAGTRHGRAHVGHHRVFELEALELGDRCRLAARPGEDREGLRPLEGQERNVVRTILEVAVVLGCFLEVSAD